MVKIWKSIIFSGIFSFFSSVLMAASFHPVIAGCYPSWDAGFTPADINYKLFTHISHSFISADVDGHLRMQGNMPSADLVARAHKAGVKVLISLGGEGSGKVFNPMAKNPKAVELFVDSVIGILRKYHYDGVNLDWEVPRNEEDGKNLTAMFTLFRKKLDKSVPGSLLTLALPPGPWAGKWFDTEALSPQADFSGIMTFAFHGPWGSPGYNANLYPSSKYKNEGSVVEVMNYWIHVKKWPASKLLLGIPCYGFAWGGGDSVPKSGEVTYRDLLKLIKEGWVSNWDSEAATPYLVGKDNRGFVSYDDEKTAELKAKWAKENHLKGIFFWDISEDVVNKENLIVKSARKTLFRK